MYCTNCKKVLADNNVFCPYCGIISKQEPLAPAETPAQESSTQQTAQSQSLTEEQTPLVQIPPAQDTLNSEPSHMQSQPAQQVPPPWAQAATGQQLQEKKKMPIWVIVTVVLAVLVALAACTFSVALVIETRRNETESSVGSSLDAGLSGWTPETHPREAEILAHLEEKYGEEFRIDFYTPEFGDGIVHLSPVGSRSLFFSLQYKDGDRELPTYEMRDDYQLALASSMVEDKIWPLVEEQFGSREIDFFNVSFTLWNVDSGTSFTGSFSQGDFMPPVDFEWKPEDGLFAFLDSSFKGDLSLSIMISLRNQDVFDEISNEDVEALTVRITGLGVVPSNAHMSIDSPASFSSSSLFGSRDGWISYSWEVQNGVIISGEFSR